jgi:uncharacterized membrane protein
MAGWEFLGASFAGVALALAALGLAVFSGLTSSRGFPPGRRALLITIRSLAVLLAVIAVLRPARHTDLTRIKRAPLAVVVDDSASMGLGRNPLSASALDWLRKNESGLRELEPWYTVERFTLGDPPPVMPKEAKFGAEGFAKQESPLSATLLGVARSRPGLAGIILLTDGRENRARDTEPPDISIPVYPVGLSGGEVKDLWIEGVDTPPVAFIRTPAEVRVRIGLSGLKPGRTNLSLYEGSSLLESTQVELKEGINEAKVVFGPKRTGRKAYRLELSPVPGEDSSENNSAQFSVGVIRDKTRVLLVAGTPTWDVKFLRDRFNADPSVDLITFLILRTPRDLSMVPESELSLIPFPTQELFEKELHTFDAVIYANFDYGPYAPPQYLENIVKFVREDGGGFAMLGGDRSFGLGGYEGTRLAEILPVELGGALGGSLLRYGPFRPRLTKAGSAHPIFQWDPDPEKNRELWNSLPELDGQNWSLRASGGGVVLAENPQAQNEYGPMPLIAIGEYGEGRSMAVLTDSLWRWKLPYAARGGDEAVYRDFWSNSLRWLMHDPDMELLRLMNPVSTLREGNNLALRARVLDAEYQPAAGAEVTGKLTGEKGEAVNLVFSEEAPGEYVAREVPLKARGIYRVEAQARKGAMVLGRDELAFPVGPASPEPQRIGLDREYLEKLAKKSGGRVLRGDEEGLYKVLREAGEKRLEVVGKKVEEPWANWMVMLLALSLFALDWTLRRLYE